MKKWAFTIIIFLSAIFIMTSNVSAKNYDLNDVNLDNISGLQYYSSNYSLAVSREAYTNDIKLWLVFWNKNYGRMDKQIDSSSYVNDICLAAGNCFARFYSNVNGESNPRYKAYYTSTDNGNTWTLMYANGYSTQPIVNGYLLKTTVDLFGYTNSTRNDKYYSAGYIYEDLGEHIKFDSSYNNEYAFVTIDFSDYLDSGYRYYYGYDELLMYDITDQIINGVYNFNAYYDDTIYAKVVDSFGNVVSEGDYEINYGMLDQYSLHFRVDNINNGNDFVKLVTDNTDYSNFWTEDEEILLYFNIRVVTGFYTDSELTNQIEFDGTWCPARDLDIYMTWTNRLPMYNRNVYISDEKLKLDLTWLNWYEEAQDYVVFYSSSQTGGNYTFNYAKYLSQQTYTFNVHYNESITLQFGKINQDHSITIFTTHSFNVENWVEHNIDEETREQMELIEQYRQEQESPNGIDSINSFIRIIAVPINFIKEILVYIWFKMNIYIKSSLITIWSTILITAIIKIIRR